MTALKPHRSLSARLGWLAQALLLLFLCGNCEVDGGGYQLRGGGFGGGPAGTAGVEDPTGTAGVLGSVDGSGGGAGPSESGSGNGNEGGTPEPGGTDPTGGTSPTESGISGGGTGGEDVSPNGGSSGNAPEVPIGSACGSDANCPEGNCVDGVCCESECGGCYACSAELTGKADGLCAPVLAGGDPHEECEDETATNPCGNEGACDGAGECRKVGSGQVCAPAACSGSQFTGAATCDGQGQCSAPAAPEQCAPYPCTPTGCAKNCSSQADCSGSSYCKIPSGETSGTCTAKNPNGVAATQTFECASGIVADGYCCDKTCGGCRACSGSPLTSGSPGECLPVVAGQVAHNACTASGSACGLDGTCDGAGACRSTPKEGESCGGNPSNLCTIAGTCSGGSCVGVSTKTCAPSTQQCRGAGTCAPATGNCTYPNAANGTTCNDGNACTQSDTCQSGNCIGSNPVSCTASNACKTASCNPSTGTCSDSGNAPNSTSCNDSNACTTSDRCQDGACIGTAIACNSPPACKVANGATCSGGSCSYPGNAGDGTSDSRCPSGTQRCFGGSCVQCTTSSHCSSPTPTCSNNACVCRQKSPGNILSNPGFDSQSVVHSTSSTALNVWINQGSNQVTATNWIDDSENCPGSKTYFTTGGHQLYQCVSVSAMTTYSFGGKIRGGGVTRFGIEWYSSTNCSGTMISSSLGWPSASEGYVTFTETAFAPGGSRSAKFFPVYIGDFGSYTDQVFMNTSSSCAPNCF